MSMVAIYLYETRMTYTTRMFILLYQRWYPYLPSPADELFCESMISAGDSYVHLSVVIMLDHSGINQDPPSTMGVLMGFHGRIRAGWFGRSRWYVVPNTTCVIRPACNGWPIYGDATSVFHYASVRTNSLTESCIVVKYLTIHEWRSKLESL